MGYWALTYAGPPSDVFGLAAFALVCLIAAHMAHHERRHALTERSEVRDGRPGP